MDGEYTQFDQEARAEVGFALFGQRDVLMPSGTLVQSKGA
jgi:hypothetical protein